MYKLLASGLAALGISGCAAPSDHLGEPDPVGHVVAVLRELDASADVPSIDGGTSIVDASIDAAPVDAAPPYIPPLERLTGVSTTERPLPPISGGTLAVAADGSLAVAADPDRDLVYVIDVGLGRFKEVALAAGSEPGRVVLDAQRAFVALRAGSVLSVDLHAASVITSTPVCRQPRGVALDGDRVWVACASGELVAVSTANLQVLDRVSVASDLRDVLVGVDGTLQLSRYRGAELLHVDRDGRQLGVRRPPSIELTNWNVELPRADGGSDWVNTTNTLSPTQAWRTVARPLGGVLMLHQQSQTDEVGPDRHDPEREAYGSGCNSLTQATITQYVDGEVRASVALAPTGLVVDMAASPDGNWVAVAQPGGYLKGDFTFRVMSIIDLSLPLADANSLLFEGRLDRANLFANSTGTYTSSCVNGVPGGRDFQATAVAYDANNRLYVYSRERAALHVFAANAGEELQEILLANSLRDTGHDLFHADVGGGVSCAGCHGEGLEDGHTWTFRGEASLPTQTVRDRHLGAHPAAFKQLLDEKLTRRMNGFVLEQRHADALARWIDSLPP